MLQPLPDITIANELPSTTLVATKGGPLPVAQNLGRLGSLNRTQRAVLVEVCQLSANGKYGCCTATNGHLMERIIASDRTVARALNDLERLGLIAVKGATKRREIHPTPLAKSCYEGTAAEAFAAVARVDLMLGNADLIPANYRHDSRQLPPTTATTTAICDGQLPPSIAAIPAILRTPYKEKSKEEQEEVITLSSRVSELELMLLAANAACSERIAEVLFLKEELKAVNEKWAEGRAKGKKLYQQNQETIAGLQEEIATLKADKATPKKQLPARLPKPIASLNPKDYQQPMWASEYFLSGFVEWLTFRQSHRAGKLQPNSVQKLLDELACYDEGFSCLLFEKAIKGGNQGLTYDDTPAKYEVYKSNQLTPFNPHHGTQQSPIARREFEQRHGLIDSGKLAASLAIGKAMGL